MDTLEIREVENFTQDPETGDLTFTNPDGSTYQMIRDPDTGHYTTTATTGGPSSVGQFEQATLHSTLNALADGDFDKVVKTAAALAASSGEDSTRQFLEDLSKSYEKYGQALKEQGDHSKAYADLWKSYADNIRSNPGLAEHLDESSRALLEKSAVSAEHAAMAAEASSIAKSGAAKISARFSNLGAVMNAANLLNALAGGQTSEIAKATFGVATGMVIGAAVVGLGGGIVIGIAVGLVASVATDFIWDTFLAEHFKDSGNFWENLFDSLGLNPSDAMLADLARDINGDNTYRLQRYDPLALDLDGDGKVGTKGSEGWNGALFDNDGDGLRAATGWVGPADGLLVCDLNGNGRIESGAELFGDQTVLANGSTAASGFGALAALDVNGDGWVDAADADFASLRVWRDANSNGVSDTGELLTLDELGITSFAAAPLNIDHQAVEGGERTGEGAFTRVDADGKVVAGTMQEFDFDSDTLHSAFADSVEIPDDLADLADLKGMGKLRDLRQACALSPGLAADVRAFSAAATREDQRAVLENLLYDWAKTSPSFVDAGIQMYGGGGVEDPNSTNVIRLRPGESVVFVPVDLPDDVVRKVRVVEAVLGWEPVQGVWWGETNLARYMQVYNAFFEGSYASLASQTRLKTYLGLIDITYSDTDGVAFSFGRMETALTAKHAASPEAAIVDMAELMKFNGQVLVGQGWLQGESMLRGWLTDVSGDTAMRGRLASAGVLIADAAAAGSNAVTVAGTAASEVLLGRNQADGVREVLNGGDGDDVILAGGGVDTLNGGVGNDLLSGGDGADTLDGGDGSDTLYGGEGSDSLSGGLGDDVLYGDAGNDSLNGGGGNDVLYGADGNDSLQGGDGNDRLIGDAGNDYLAGNAGNDIYVFGRGAGHDTINNYDNTLGRKDVLQFDAGVSAADVKAWRSGDDLCLQINGTEDRIDIQYYFRNDGTSDYRLDEVKFADGTTWSIDAVKAMVLVAGNGNDDIYGYETDDVIVGSVDNDWLVGRGGNDTLSGGGGADSLSGDDGNDTLAGDAGNDSLSGGAGDDELNGGADNDRLAGGGGNDRLQGGAGDDYLSGDTGNDTYVFARGDGSDTIYNHDADAGRLDRLEFAAGIVAADVIALRVGDDLSLQFNNSDDRILVQHYFKDDATGAFRLDAIRFADGTEWDVDAVKVLVQASTDGNDTLVGYAGDDLMAGGLGDDTLTGAGGNDTLSGGAGNDLLDGGDGADTLAGDDGNDTLTGGTGDDHLSGGAGMDALYGGDGSDTLMGGTDRDWLAGEAGADALYGGQGDDELHGGAGNDILAGGTGSDVLYGGQDEDRYVFARGDGKDRVVDVDGLSTLALEGLTASDVRMRRDGTTLVIRFESSAGDEVRFENFFDSASGLATMALVIDGGSPWNLSKEDIDEQAMLGTATDDVIFGNALGNVINGLGGNDVIHGGAGDDAIDGGDGNDQLFGGVGNDQLFGSGGDDLLDGRSGQDQMHGGSGDDLYVVDDQGDLVVEVVGDGEDTIQSSVSYTLAANVERLELSGSASIDGTGNALGNAMIGNSAANLLSGLDGDDILQGNAGDDTLIGGAGNDLLDGGYGVDEMTGGTGDDTYVVDTEGDVIVEQAGEGFDVVNAHSSYTLSANIEKLVLVEGSGAWSGTGNGSANTILGNSSSNRLDGGAGGDTLTGGLGDDTYVVDNVGDQIIELVGEGTDTVESSINYVLGATLENLTLLGTANLNGTGNDQDNVLVGNAGNNRLEGGLGADSLHGGMGNDYYIEESSGDWVYENAGEGTDTVERRYETLLVLKDHVENLILASGVKTGNGNGLANTITGNAGANTLGGWDGDDLLQGLAGDDALFGGNGNDQLLGGAGNDYLDGGAGIDQLKGGSGNDTYIIDDSADVVTEGANAGTDAVQATASYTLSANIENLFLMEGAGAINGTGNAMDNYLSGNAANNVLQGMAGSDTIAAGGGDDLLIGGLGDDKYVFDATTGSNVLDNTGGGNDGVFFTNGVDRDRLSFGRDGDDLLIFVDAAATPSVRVTNHFLGGDAAIDYVQPDGGFMLTTAQINQIVAGGGTGGQYDQVIEGTAAAEQLVGSAGKDLIKGLAGDDQLFGLGGDDTLQGGDGDDYLAGGGGSGSGSGADRLEGGAGNDTLNGEDGVNVLIGGAGDDSYVYGGGQDTVDNTAGGFDGVFFNNGVTAAQLGFSRDGDDLLITVADSTANTVRVTNHFLGGDWAIDYVQPASGSMLDTAAINALVGSGGDPGTPTVPGNDGDYTNIVEGTAAGEQLLGTNGRDLIHGLGGNDTLFGFGGDDKFDGGDGDDYLSGGNGSFSGSGNDILIGGAGVDTLVGEDGNDLLIGGTGNDKYIWQAGSGSDVIDNTGGGTDWLFFNGVDRTRLSFHRSGDDLLIRVDGDAAQQVRVQNHFLGGDLAISYVQPSDGYAIAASNFGSLLTPLPAGLMAMDGVSSMLDGTAATFDQGLDTGDVAHRASHSFAGKAELRLRTRWGVHSDLTLATEAVWRSSPLHNVGAPVGREVQQLIEAMSRFNPMSGEVSSLDQDAVWGAAPLVADHAPVHRFSETRTASII